MMSVTVEQIIRVLNQNAENACNVVREAVAAMPRERTCGCGAALQFALMTGKDLVPPATRKRLSFLLDKYWGKDHKAGA